MSYWTEEKHAELLKLNDEGLSASQIAAVLGGISRNAVIGRLHRAGIKKRPTRVAIGELRMTTPKTTPRRRVKLPESPLPVPANMPAEKPTPENAIGFWDLAANSCRYPHGATPPYKYCGAQQIAGSSYCAYHHRLCNSPAQFTQRMREGLTTWR